MRLLVFVFLFLAGSLAHAQFTYDNLSVDYDGAIEFRNLRLIPIRARATFFDTTTNRGLTDLTNALTLQEAMATGQVRISETGLFGTVNSLVFENLSNRPILLLSGEVVTGGRQDRVIARDIILQPRSGEQRVDVFCVEEGRWSGNKQYTYYHEASMHLRKIVDRDANQSKVWKEIKEENARDNVRTGTQAYTAHSDNRGYLQSENEYLTATMLDKFANPNNIVGIVGITGGVVMGCDIFVSPEIFRREYNTTVFSYIDEALTFGMPISIAPFQIKNYLDQLLTNEVMQQRFIDQNGKMYRENGKVYHITTYESPR
ncbi:MAG: ARPP-1 family domain-containing protein [Candidatus Kapaibacteriota bacterium]